MSPELAAKKDGLLDRLRGEPLLIAFSGGVDSSLLLAAAREAAPAALLAVTGVSPSLARAQLEQARAVARTLGVEHLELGTEELADPRYAANPGDRCYFCKHELFGRLRRRFGDLWPRIADGTNADDLGGHRPGLRAAREEGVISPLAEQGLTKDEVRALSRHYGLATAELPASPCLASRVVTGLAIDATRLGRIERAEDALRGLGFREFRLRDLGDRARFELSANEQGRVAARRSAIESAVLATGFAAVEIDPRPLRSGRLSEESA